MAEQCESRPAGNRAATDRTRADGSRPAYSAAPTPAHGRRRADALRECLRPGVELPADLLAAPISDRAVRLWAVIDGHQLAAGAAPSRSHLADDLDCSVDTIDRLTAELAALGWMRVARGAGRPTTYRAVRPSPTSRTDAAPATETGRSAAAPDRSGRTDAAPVPFVGLEAGDRVRPTHVLRTLLAKDPLGRPARDRARAELGPGAPESAIVERAVELLEVGDLRLQLLPPHATPATAGAA